MSTAEMLKVLTNEMDEAQTSQQYNQLIEVKSKKFQSLVNSNQESVLTNLPEEMLLSIFESLSTSDAITMAKTCKFMADFVSRNYAFRLVLQEKMLPSNLYQKNIELQYVLSMVSSLDITVQQDHWKGESFKKIKRFVLEGLHKLDFVLWDYGMWRCGCKYRNLPPWYHKILSRFLSHAKMLTHICIAIDRSEGSFKMIDTVAKSLPFLNKVALNSATDHEAGDLPLSFTLNELLRRLLENSSIQSLEILELGGGQNWGVQESECDMNDLDNFKLYPLKILSPHLLHLKIEEYVFCEIEELTCPELQEFRYSCLLEEFRNPKSKCLVHNLPFAEGMNFATLLTGGCPKLEIVNGFDVKQMRNCMVDTFSSFEWQRLLEAACDCDVYPSEWLE